MAKIVCLGEAWGENEERERAAFVGAAGYELTRLLDEVGLHRADIHFTNVINQRPPSNRIEAFCGGKAEALKGYPPLIKGKYIRAEFEHELLRLGDELIAENPNLIIALGNTATWALLGQAAISKHRGTTALSTHTVEGFKVLGTYHPAAVLRQWELRPVVVVDLQKAKREAEFPEVRRPKCTIWIEPTIEDIYAFHSQFITGCKILSVDIETAGNQITSIGFAPSKHLALVIPIFDPRKLGRSYWPTESREREAWRIIAKILSGPEPKLFQNGAYDIAFLWRAYGIKVMNAAEDTMLLHHSLQPESLKGLGFLGSVYTDHSAWKQERKFSTTIKRED